MMSAASIEVALLVHERAPCPPRCARRPAAPRGPGPSARHGNHHRRRQPRRPRTRRAAPASSHRRRVMPSTPSAACSMTSRAASRESASRGRCSTFVSCQGTSQRPASTSAQASKASAAASSADPATAYSGRAQEQGDERRAPRRAPAAAQPRPRRLRPCGCACVPAQTGPPRAAGRVRAAAPVRHSTNIAIAFQARLMRCSLAAVDVQGCSFVRSPEQPGDQQQGGGGQQPTATTFPSGIGPIRPMPQPPGLSGCWMLWM